MLKITLVSKKWINFFRILEYWVFGKFRNHILNKKSKFVLEKNVKGKLVIFNNLVYNFFQFLRKLYYLYIGGHTPLCNRHSIFRLALDKNKKKRKSKNILKVLNFRQKVYVER